MHRARRHEAQRPGQHQGLALAQALPAHLAPALPVRVPAESVGSHATRYFCRVFPALATRMSRLERKARLETVKHELPDLAGVQADQFGDGMQVGRVAQPVRVPGRRWPRQRQVPRLADISTLPPTAVLPETGW